MRLLFDGQFPLLIVASGLHAYDDMQRSVLKIRNKRINFGSSEWQVSTGLFISCSKLLRSRLRFLYG